MYRCSSTRDDLDLGNKPQALARLRAEGHFLIAQYSAPCRLHSKANASVVKQDDGLLLTATEILTELGVEVIIGENVP